MGRGDSRNSPKMRRRKAQNSLKARAARKLAAAAAARPQAKPAPAPAPAAPPAKPARDKRA